MAEQDNGAYAKNKAWGEQKEHEAADILESVYPELMIRRTDITGKVIYKQAVNNKSELDNETINIKGLTKGMYIVQVLTNKNIINKNIVIY